MQLGTRQTWHFSFWEKSSRILCNNFIFLTTLFLSMLKNQPNMTCLRGPAGSYINNSVLWLTDVYFHIFEEEKALAWLRNRHIFFFKLSMKSSWPLYQESSLCGINLNCVNFRFKAFIQMQMICFRLRTNHRHTLSGSICFNTSIRIWLNNEGPSLQIHYITTVLSTLF